MEAVSHYEEETCTSLMTVSPVNLTIEEVCVAEDSTEHWSLADLVAKSISVTEASEISGFTSGWIRQLLIRGEIVGFKVGRDWRLTREALQEYIDKERRPGPKID